MRRGPWHDRPRRLAALVFGVAGLVVPAAWYGPLVVASGRPSLWVLYLGIPTFSAAMAGAAGARTLGPGCCRSAGRAALRGAGLALAAFVLFSFLFGAALTWFEPGWGWRSILGLATLTLSVGLLVSCWLIVPLGAAAGWVVWRVLGRGAPAPP